MQTSRAIRPTAILLALATACAAACTAPAAQPQTAAAPAASVPALDTRMAWWREARFGMFIHWGLYAIPAGVWGTGETAKNTYGEWIRHEARIPLREYDKLQSQFNPAAFNADTIVKAAKNAGMSYIVITSKHHDGFCLFDSAVTDFDVMGSPFKRDIMAELAAACRREGIKMCWYYSIMDWHHPDYLPRRDWEKEGDHHPTKAADLDRYIAYMKAQLKELLTKYGDIGVLWFDGQWEGSWNDERGRDLEAYVRSLAPNIIINSRVGRGGGAYGLDGTRLGDYSTPEQFIPDFAPPGDWETCMTMNGHWGYNAADKKFKSTTDLVRKLIDIASKGGNFLLNIGPDAAGNIPPESVERLAEIGTWMSRNAEAIRGTRAGPFPKPFDWGRCTMRHAADSQTTRLYLHVFEPPANGKLVIPGIYSSPVNAWRLDRPSEHLAATSTGDAITLDLSRSSTRPDPIATVYVLDIVGDPDIALPPVITGPEGTISGTPLADAKPATPTLFMDSLAITLSTARKGVEVRYTLDGREPDAASPVATGPIMLATSVECRARCFRDGKPVSPVTMARFTRASARPAEKPASPVANGLNFELFEMPGDIKLMDEMLALKPVATGTTSTFDLSIRRREKNWGARFTGFVDVPADGIYRFFTNSDDGSRLRIGDALIVDNDTPHSLQEASGTIALAKGLHPITVEYFENWGGYELSVSWSGPGIAKERIPGSRLKR